MIGGRVDAAGHPGGEARLERAALAGGQPARLESEGALQLVKAFQLLGLVSVDGDVNRSRRAISGRPAGGVLELLRNAYEVLPGITELQLAEAAAGHRPATPDNQPVIGEADVPGLVWASGHWRNGVLLAPLTAEAVVALIADGETRPEVRAFCPRRFAEAEVAS